ncbi:MAG: hypothetical protein RI897_4119 [Verrucomicrobiota bacterium]
MDDEAGEEEADQDGGSEGEGVLVVLGDFVEGDEEEEAEESERGVMGYEDGEAHEQDMSDCDPEGDGVVLGFSIAVGGHFEAGEVFPEDLEVGDIGDEDTEDGDPAEVLEHEGGIPAPGGGDHEDGGGGEVGEGSADGDIDEEEAECGVGEFEAGFFEVELGGEEGGGDGHGCGFRDERAEEGAEREDSEPPGDGGSSPEVGEPAHDLFGELEDGSGGGHEHDDHDEDGFGEADAGVDVTDGIFEADHDGHDAEEGDEPEAEDGFDLAEEVEDAGGDADVEGFIAAFGFVLVVAIFEDVGDMAEALGEERVDYCAEEQHCGPEVEGLFLDAVLEDGPDRGEVAVFVA